jgi:hypothetical protein
MPPFVFLVLQGIQAAIQAAPQVKEVIDAGKQMISSLFTANVITKEQQDTLHAQVDQIADDFANGRIPSSWLVKPDPAS